MELVVKSKSVEINYYLLFKEPLFSLAEQEIRLTMIKKILGDFGLRLNDIKFNDQSPSNDYIHFYKFIGQCFLDVFFGLEEMTAKIGTPLNEEQVVDLLGKLFRLVEAYPIALQRIGIQRHLEAKGSIEKYLESLNPAVPKNFQDFLSGRGVIYNLRFPENELNIQVLVTNSLLVENGIYLFMEFNFSPNKYDFDSALNVIKSQYDLILSEIQLKIENEN